MAVREGNTWGYVGWHDLGDKKTGKGDWNHAFALPQNYRLYAARFVRRLPFCWLSLDTAPLLASTLIPSESSVNF